MYFPLCQVQFCVLSLPLVLLLLGCETDLEKLKGSNNCVRCYLKGVDLTGAELKGANLNWSFLEQAHLDRANLAKANLNGADLQASACKEPL